MAQDPSAAEPGGHARNLHGAQEPADVGKFDDAQQLGSFPESGHAQELGLAQRGEDAAGVAASRHAAPRGPGRPPAGGADKHERILTEAVGLFAEHGYAGTSLRAVADSAKITKAVPTTICR